MAQKQFYRRRKVCKFCLEKIDSINYKDAKLLSQFVPERAKILPVVWVVVFMVEVLVVQVVRFFAARLARAAFGIRGHALGLAR